MVIGRRTGADIIPDSILESFPLSPEPISEWNEETDLYKILESLHDASLTVLSEDGQRSTGRGEPWSADMFRAQTAEFHKWIVLFAKSSRKSQADVDLIVHFSDDAEFGRAAKHVITWDNLIHSILADSTFFSIAHALESNDDLHCSIHLAAHLYYKQAMQVLRSYLEDLVLPIRFFAEPDDFERWKLNDYRVPPFRSSRNRRGLLEQLSDSGLISTALAEETAELYGELNAYIHAGEATLINKLGDTSQPAGHVFKVSDFHKWCDYVSRLVEVGVKLLKVNVDQWENYRETHQLICTMCHNKNGFQTTQSEFGGELFSTYTCAQCENSMTFSSQSELTHKVEIFNPLEGEVESHHRAMQATAALSEDPTSIDSVIKTLYEAFSFEAGATPNWNRLHALFLPGARLMTTLGTTQTNIFTFTGLVEFFEEVLMGSDLQLSGLRFVEASREVRKFKNIYNVWSEYRVSSASDNSTQSTGANSIQMVWGSDQFWIVTLLWNMEGDLEPPLSGQRRPLSRGSRIPRDNGR